MDGPFCNKLHNYITVYPKKQQFIPDVLTDTDGWSKVNMVIIMRKRISAFSLVCLCILICAGCQAKNKNGETGPDISGSSSMALVSQNGSDHSNLSEPINSSTDIVIDKREGTLRVAHPISNNVLFDYAIDMFAKKYPNVTIIKDTGYENDCIEW